MYGEFSTQSGRKLDEFDAKVIETSMNMTCSSFFFTVQKIMEDFDIPKEHVRKVEEAVFKCSEQVWDVAYDISRECGDAEASLFTSAFMVNMILELVDHTLKSQLLMEAEDILNGGGE